MTVDLYLGWSLLVFFVCEFQTSWPSDSVSAYTYWDINSQSSKLYINKRREGFVAIPSYTLITLFTQNSITHAHTYTNSQNMSIYIITKWLSSLYLLFLIIYLHYSSHQDKITFPIPWIFSGLVTYFNLSNMANMPVCQFWSRALRNLAHLCWTSWDFISSWIVIPASLL